MSDSNDQLRKCEKCSVASIGDVLFWRGARNTWNETGDKSFIIKGLRSQQPIPPNAREFIADLIEGKAKRKPTLKKIREEQRNRFIKGNYQSIFTQLKKAKKKGLLEYGKTPADLAITELADMYELSEDSIKSIIRRKK